MVLTHENFTKFVGIIKSMSALVKDLQIVDGKICQKDSDTNWVIVGDLSSILGNIDPALKTISLYSIDNRSPMLKMFADSDNDVEFTFVEEEQRYKFYDGMSSFTVRVPDEKTMQKKYDVGNLDAMLYDPSKMLTEFEFDKKFIKRATTAIQAYNTDIAEIIYDSNTSTARVNFGGKIATNGSLDLFTNLKCGFPFVRTSMKLNILKTGVGDSVSVKAYMATDEIIARSRCAVAVISIKTELCGCPFEYLQKRGVDL